MRNPKVNIRMIVTQGNLGLLSFKISLRTPYKTGPGKLPNKLLIKLFKYILALLHSLGILQEI